MAWPPPLEWVDTGLWDAGRAQPLVQLLVEHFPDDHQTSGLLSRVGPGALGVMVDSVPRQERWERITAALNDKQLLGATLLQASILKPLFADRLAALPDGAGRHAGAVMAVPLLPSGPSLPAFVHGPHAATYEREWSRWERLTSDLVLPPQARAIVSRIGWAHADAAVEGDRSGRVAFVLAVAATLVAAVGWGAAAWAARSSAGTSRTVFGASLLASILVVVLAAKLFARAVAGQAMRSAGTAHAMRRDMGACAAISAAVASVCLAMGASFWVPWGGFAIRRPTGDLLGYPVYGCWCAWVWLLALWGWEAVSRRLLERERGWDELAVERLIDALDALDPGTRTAPADAVRLVRIAVRHLRRVGDDSVDTAAGALTTATQALNSHEPDLDAARSAIGTALARIVQAMAARFRGL